MLHVHDLVDYVSEEAAAAGRNAAAYIQSGGWDEKGRSIPIRCGGGVRYTVPAAIRPGALEGKFTLRLRVSGVCRNRRIVVYAGDTPIFSRRRPVLAPSEMETVQLRSALLLSHPEAEQITVTLEEA